MQERINLFIELISCVHPLFYWRYDENKNLLSSTCSSEKVLDAALCYTGGLEFIYTTPGTAPLILSNDSNLMWIAVREISDNRIIQAHVVGPFFSNEVHNEGIERMIGQIGKHASIEWNQILRNELKNLPALSLPTYCQYIIMLYYLVTGEKVSVSSIQYQTDNKAVPTDFSNLKTRTPPKDRMMIYRAERALLNSVREGYLNGETAMLNAINIAKVRQYTDNPLKNAQIACTTFVTLCTRAAIEGGLSTTISYSLGDAYIKSIFLAKSLSDVADIKNQMYKDFITRVHECRSNPRYSKMVQSSCDYIELHLEEPLNIDVLASRLGYSKYYLSTRFKKETNCSVNDYIKFARIERAKVLLSTTNKNIADIAEMTGFVSRSFFANTFKKCVGKTSAQYRKETLSV